MTFNTNLPFQLEEQTAVTSVQLFSRKRESDTERVSVLPKKRLSMKRSTASNSNDNELVIVESPKEVKQEKAEKVKEEEAEEVEEEDDSADFVLDLSSSVRRRSQENVKPSEMVSIPKQVYVLNII